MSRAARTHESDARHHSKLRRLLLTLVTLALLVVSVHSVAFSGASFVDESRNPGNMFAAGTIDHQNSRRGELILDATNLRPGQSVSETVTITGGGDFAGVYAISRLGLDDPLGLASALTLRIDNVSAGTTPFNTTLASFSAVPAGTIAPGASATYRFTLSYPAAAASSQLQGASMSMTVGFMGVTQ